MDHPHLDQFPAPLAKTASRDADIPLRIHYDLSSVPARDADCDLILLAAELVHGNQVGLRHHREAAFCAYTDKLAAAVVTRLKSEAAA